MISYQIRKYVEIEISFLWKSNRFRTRERSLEFSPSTNRRPRLKWHHRRKAMHCRCRVKIAVEIPWIQLPYFSYRLKIAFILKITFLPTHNGSIVIFTLSHSNNILIWNSLGCRFTLFWSFLDTIKIWDGLAWPSRHDHESELWS